MSEAIERKIKNLREMINAAEEKRTKLRCQILLYQDQIAALQTKMAVKTTISEEERKQQSEKDKENYRSKLDALKAKYIEQYRREL